MNIHTLKTVNPHFQDLAKGNKTFELRKNDRDFRVGDKLILLEYTETDKIEHLHYTGRGYTALVQHILEGGQYGLEQGYVIMSLEPGNEIKI